MSLFPKTPLDYVARLLPIEQRTKVVRSDTKRRAFCGAHWVQVWHGIDMPCAECSGFALAIVDGDTFEIATFPDGKVVRPRFWAPTTAPMPWSAS